MRMRRAKAVHRRGNDLVFEGLEARRLLAGGVIINEFLAANQRNERDDFRQYSDWIELWNPSEEVAELDSYYLTDDPDDPSKWTFPADARMMPGEFLIVRASGLDTVDGDGIYHTNFQLDAGGDYLALLDAATLQVVSEFSRDGQSFPRQFGDVSYGIQGPPPGLIASDVPQTIDASRASTITSQIPVNGLLGTVTDVNVSLSIEHTAVGDLTLHLISPRGTRVELVSGLGGEGDNFTETIFDDESPFAISSFGVAPFTGFFQPTSPLTAVDGESAEGVWTLEVVDATDNQGGQLLGWSMSMETSEGGELQSEGLVGYLAEPTPGQPNAIELKNTGPSIESVTDRIGPWSAEEDIVVSATLSAVHDSVANVHMVWRVGYEPEHVVPMRDDGLQGDAAAGDSIYTAIIPSNAFEPGQMVRWAVLAEDRSGRTARAPKFLDRTGSNQSAEYFGTVIEDPSVTTQLDVFQWFIEPGTERRADSFRGTRSSIFYLDQFYDNVYVRVRGNSSTNLPKKSYKFDFNTGEDFRFSEDAGRVTEINLNTTYTNKDYIRQALAFETYDQAGVMGSEAFPLRIDRNGQFFSVAIFVEQPDEDLLEREGRDPEGALYKMFSRLNTAGGAEKRTRKYESNDDLSEFVREINRRSGESLRNYLMDHVNLPAVLNYLAATVIIQNNDQMAKNYYLYRDTNGTGQWEFLPWDLDLVFGLHFMSNDNIRDDTIWADKDAFTTFAGVTIWPSHPFVGDQDHPANRSWNRLIDALYQVPEIREMHLRRLRSLMDELLQPPGTPESELRFEQRLDEYFALIEQDAKLDYEKWADPWWGDDETLEQSFERIKNEFLAVRRQHLYITHGIDNVDNGEDLAGIPHRQPDEVSVTIGDEIEIVPESGDARQRYFTIHNPNGFAVDLSDWSITGSIQHRLAKGTVIPADSRLYLSPDVNAFRARTTGPSGNQGLLVQQIEGNLSAAGGQLMLRDHRDRIVSSQTYRPSEETDQQALRISEINFNPYPAMRSFGERDLDNDAFEFVEIVNAGTQTVSLAGVQLVEIQQNNDAQGVAFQFESGHLLPGERSVVVKSRVGFGSRYGDHLSVAGEYSGKLSNGGETLTLVDRNYDIIQQFRYDDDDLWMEGLTDGGGATLEWIGQASADPGDPENWQASPQFGGTPGTEPLSIETTVVINELLSAPRAPLTDRVELYNTTGASVDVSGWYISDNRDAFRFQIPASTTPIPPGGFLVWEADQLGFGWKADDQDDVRLIQSDPSGRPLYFADYVQFPPAEAGSSFGRWPDGNGPLRVMAELSFGAPNPAPETLSADLNGDLRLSVDDVDYFCQQFRSGDPNLRADMNNDSAITQDDLLILLPLLNTTLGDANFDGTFDSSDLVTVFQAGRYEDAAGNASWSSGDWNCDGNFDTRDLVFAFQSSAYVG